MSASIFTRAGFEPFVLAQPAATLVHQWRDDSVAKVGGKIFALLDNDPGEVWLKVSELAFDMLIELPGIRPAPYFARASWVAVSPGAPLGEDELRAYIVEAHRLIATRLTRRSRTELALDGLIAAGPRRS
ncbi:putative DNA-binding protein (MmcQ/YjbR family) [Devosia sp. UYZn731]|uniref:MmcQ/YjbR family DNA-binding protein n=1 Tax=Devosia sp. UYZn731 TaxID=3156345 RepID=UPI00339B0418